MFHKCIFFLLCVFALSGLSFGQWDFTKIDGWAGTRYTSDIAYKSNGYPVIAYCHDNYIAVAQWDGTNWHEQNVGYFASNYGNPPKVLITTDNVVFVVSCYTNDGKTHLYRVGTGEVTNFVGQITDAILEPGSTGSNYFIHFVYSGLYYRRYPSPNTQVYIDAGSYPKIAQDNNGHLHVAYYGGVGGNVLRYAYYDGTTWTTWPVEPVMNAQPRALLVDNNNVPTVYTVIGSAVKQIVIQR